MATIPGKQFVWHQSKLCKLSIQSVHPNANDLFQIENKSSPYSFRQHSLQYKYTYLTEQRRAFASDSLYYNCLIHVILSSHTIIWNSGNVTIHQHAGDRQIRHNLNKKQGQFFYITWFLGLTFAVKKTPRIVMQFEAKNLHALKTIWKPYLQSEMILSRFWEMMVIVMETAN